MNIFKKTALAIAISSTIVCNSLAQNPDYEAGQKALHAQSYHQAYENFKKSESSKDYREASLYWQAYTLFKLKQNHKARQLLKSLLDEYPQGRWTDSATVLLFENSPGKDRDKYFIMKDMFDGNYNFNSDKSRHHERPERPERPEQPERPERPERPEKIELNEELRLYALQEMFFKDPESSLPKLKEIIEKSQKSNETLHALQLLGLSDSLKAQEYLYEFILNNKKKGLSQQAIQMLSMRGSESSNQMLYDLYNKVKDKELKTAVIQGFIHSEDSKKVKKLIEKEKDQDLVGQMIQLLGVFGASKELAELSKTLNSSINKSQLIQALAISGDSQSIKELIEKSSDKAEKIQAIESLAIIDDESTEPYLLELYERLNDAELKQALSTAFIITEVEADKLKELIEREQDLVNKERLLDTMVALGDEKELVELFNAEKDFVTKTKILNMLGAYGASEEVKELYESIKDEDLKLQAIHAMAISTDDEGFLMETYHDGNHQVKEAVIQSFVMQSNDSALSELLSQEKDPELKKSILRALMESNPDLIIDKLSQSGELQ